MQARLKPLCEQIIVITGATSGIGLVTARMASAAGAKLVLAARSEEALTRLVEEIGAGEAAAVAADVGVEADVRRIAEAAVERFGGFDTWVNNAGISIYGKVEEVTIDDQKRLFDTNYWGVVFGSRIACEHLRRRGGKLVTVGSSLSERAIPLQGVYSASKAAVLGFTEALRMELQQDGAPVSVTLIKPGAVDTPYKQHAGNYLEVEPQNPPPVYAPETVARSILYACEHHPREIVVGAGGKILTTLGNLAPGLSDRVMTRLMPRMQRTERPQPGIQRGTLYRPEPGAELHERAGYPLALEHSLYTAARRHRVATTLAATVGAAAVVYGLRKAGRRRQAPRH